MNDSEMQIAIAEACGWKLHPKNDSIVIPPNSPNSVQPRHTLPDYLNDLNAMHEAEEVLRNDQFNYTSYWRHLFQVVAGKEWTGDIGYFHFEMAHATSTQRAEAFLKTLKLWKP
jgi:hypothetical protein